MRKRGIRSKKSADGKNTLAILDAKYKHLEEANIPREDYFQVLAYMFRFDCNRGVLVFPYCRSEKFSDSAYFLKDHSKKISFLTKGFVIPESAFPADEKSAYQDFFSKMNESESEFISWLGEKCG